MKNLKKLLPSILMFITLCGCWDTVELENRSFVISIGIDKYSEKKNGSMHDADDANRFTISMEIPDPAALKDDNKNKFVKNGSGRTILSSIHLIGTNLNSSLYFGQTKLAVLSSDVLSQPELLREAVDTLERNSEFSRKLGILSTDKEAKSILDSKTAAEPLIGMFVSNFYNNNSNPAISLKLNLESLINSLRADGTAIIPKISSMPADTDNDQQDDNKESEIRLGGAAVIKDFKLVGWLNDAETRGLLYVKQGTQSTRLSAEFENSYTAIRINSINSKIDFIKKEENADYICAISIKIKAVLEEHNFTNNDTLDNKLITLAVEYENIIKSEILNTSKKFKEWETDGFKLKEELRKKHNIIYKQYENDINAYLKNLEIIPDVKLEITGTGAVK